MEWMEDKKNAMSNREKVEKRSNLLFAPILQTKELLSKLNKLFYCVYISLNSMQM